MRYPDHTSALFGISEMITEGRTKRACLTTYSSFVNEAEQALCEFRNASDGRAKYCIRIVAKGPNSHACTSRNILKYCWETIAKPEVMGLFVRPC